MAKAYYEKGDFTVVPNIKILKGKKPSVISVYLFICTYANEKGECFPSRARLMKDTEQSKNTVDRAIKELELLELLEKVVRVKDGVKQTNLYRLLLNTEGGVGSQMGLPSPHKEDIELYPINYNNSSKEELGAKAPDSPSKPEAPELEEKPNTPPTLSKDQKVKEVYKVFDEQGFDIKMLWANKTQRTTAELLYDTVGCSKIALSLEFYKENKDTLISYTKNGEKPVIWFTITSPSTLATHLPELRVIKKNKDKGLYN